MNISVDSALMEGLAMPTSVKRDRGGSWSNPNIPASLLVGIEDAAADKRSYKSNEPPEAVREDEEDRDESEEIFMMKAREARNKKVMRDAANFSNWMKSEKVSKSHQAE